ncbi:hypothetical protein J6590_027558 [Homalodisca vitripennis]|nr:hypothetical protein J6590_027558 [Homalodisca vitripennis]
MITKPTRPSPLHMEVLTPRGPQVVLLSSGRPSRGQAAAGREVDGRDLLCLPRGTDRAQGLHFLQR